jgi:hypothetical protein
MYKKFNCNFCQQELFTNKNVCDKKQLLRLYKNYTPINDASEVKAPSNNFNNVINKFF